MEDMHQLSRTRARRGTAVVAATALAAALWVASPTQAALADPGDMLYGTVTSGLALYDAPDEGSDVVATLPSGFTFRALEGEGGWYSATYAVDGVTMTVYFDDLSGIARYTAATSEVMHGAVTGAGLTVYAAPSGDAASLATYGSGTTIQFCDFDGTYYMARVADGTIGYIPAASVALYAPSESGVLARYAGSDGANVYEAPDERSAVLASFDAGTSLSFVDFNDDWLMANMSIDGTRRTIFVPKSQVSTEPPEAGGATGGTGQLGASTVTYVPYDITLSELTDVEYEDSWIVWSPSATTNWATATKDQLRSYLNPANFTAGTPGFYQFLRLDVPSAMSVDEINDRLDGEGVLAGHGEAFATAAQTYGINEAYLISHARLETGNGTSQLATGVWYDPDTDKVYESDEEAATHPHATLVYNMFGIGAYDAAPLYGGAKRAYEEGWTSVDAAIVGGAQFIGTTYLRPGSVTLSGQNTLYKMLFHPEQAVINAAGSGEKPWHEYATDIAWASKQAVMIAQFYGDPSDYSLAFDVPSYAGD